jgi:hypothetical protein
MSTSLKTPDDDARFDRLVDGALTPAEYKNFVAALDDDPGGWRRCAMAFLEAQAWGKEFAAIRRAEQDVPFVPLAAEVKRAHPRRIWFSAGSVLCAAASLVLAFGLGIFTHGKLFTPRTIDRLASSPPSKAALKPDVSPTEPAEKDGIDHVRLVIDRGAGLSPQEIVVSLQDAAEVGSNYVPAEPAISDRVLRSLQLRGHRIDRQQEYIPIDLQDGRQVILPVEEYRITPVSSKSY